MSNDIEGDNFFAALSQFQNQPEKVIQNKIYFTKEGEIKKVSADPTTDDMGLESIDVDSDTATELKLNGTLKHYVVDGELKVRPAEEKLSSSDFMLGKTEVEADIGTITDANDPTIVHGTGSEVDDNQSKYK